MNKIISNVVIHTLNLMKSSTFVKLILIAFLLVGCATGKLPGKKSALNGTYYFKYAQGFQAHDTLNPLKPPSPRPTFYSLKFRKSHKLEYKTLSKSDTPIPRPDGYKKFIRKGSWSLSGDSLTIHLPYYGDRGEFFFDVNSSKDTLVPLRESWKKTTLFIKKH